MMAFTRMVTVCRTRSKINNSSAIKKYIVGVPSSSLGGRGTTGSTSWMNSYPTNPIAPPVNRGNPGKSTGRYRPKTFSTTSNPSRTWFSPASFTLRLTVYVAVTLPPSTTCT